MKTPHDGPVIECQPTPLPWAVGKGGRHLFYVNPKIEAGDTNADGSEIDDPEHDSIIARFKDMGSFSGCSEETERANCEYAFRALHAFPEAAALFDQIECFCPVAFQDKVREWRTKFGVERHQPVNGPIKLGV